MKTYLEYKDDKLAKFWEVEVNNNILTIYHGRIGFLGTTETIEFDLEENALKYANKLLNSKFKNGYTKVSSSKKGVYTHKSFLFRRDYRVYYDFSGHINQIDTKEYEEFMSSIPKQPIKDIELKYGEDMLKELKDKNPSAIQLCDYILLLGGEHIIKYNEANSVSDIMAEWKTMINISVKSYKDLIKQFGNHQLLHDALEELLGCTEYLDFPDLKVPGTDMYQDWHEMEPYGFETELSFEDVFENEYDLTYLNIDSLCNAADQGNYNKLGKYVEMGVDIHALDSSGKTPLFAAVDAWDENTKIVEYLLLKGANVNSRNHENSTPLHIALQLKRRDTAKVLLQQGADIMATDNRKDTIFHLACKAGMASLVKELLSQGVDVNIKGSNDFTPLHYACYEGEREIADILIAHNAKINVTDNKGFTPLHRAAAVRSIKVGWKDTKPGIDSTVYSPELELVKFLVENGADTTIRNNKNQLASDIANEDVKKYLENLS